MSKAHHQVDDVLPLEDDRRAREQPEILPSPASLPNAMTEPENVIAPMNVPMNSSTRLPAGIGIADAERRRVVDDRDGDEHRREADERVHRRHELGHLRHLHALRDEPADEAANGERADRAGRCAAVIANVVSTASAMPTMPKRLPRRAVSGWERPLQGEDEEHARHEIGRARPELADIVTRRLLRRGLFFLNISSIRSVTRKPPNVLMATSATATAPRIVPRPICPGSGGEDGADDDHRADGVGDAHQRRVQRRRHVPDHVIADEDGQHEHRQVGDDGVDGDSVHRQLLTGAPSMQTSVAAMISSDRLSVSSPVLGSSSRVMKLSRLRA